MSARGRRGCRPIVPPHRGCGPTKDGDPSASLSPRPPGARRPRPAGPRRRAGDRAAARAVAADGGRRQQPQQLRLPRPRREGRRERRRPRGHRGEVRLRLFRPDHRLPDPARPRRAEPGYRGLRDRPRDQGGRRDRRLLLQRRHPGLRRELRRHLPGQLRERQRPVRDRREAVRRAARGSAADRGLRDEERRGQRRAGDRRPLRPRAPARLPEERQGRQDAPSLAVHAAWVPRAACLCTPPDPAGDPCTPRSSSSPSSPRPSP